MIDVNYDFFLSVDHKPQGNSNILDCICEGAINAQLSPEQLAKLRQLAQNPGLNGQNIAPSGQNNLQM